MNNNMYTFKSLNYETQKFLILVFSFIDFINENNCKITINEKNNTKKTYSFDKKYPTLGLAIFLSILYLDIDYKTLLNNEGITLSNVLKQFNKTIKNFVPKNDIKDTISFNQYNLDELLDEMFENEKEVYELDYDNKNIDDENYDIDINIDKDTKIFQFINLLISSPSMSNYVKLVLKKLYKLDDYYSLVIYPKLIDKLNYDAQEYYLSNYDICIELLDTINNIEYEYDNLNLIQNKDNCFIHLKKQITINSIKIPKYLKIERIEINDKVYSGINLIKVLLFNEINGKIKFICNNIEFSINKEILFGESKQDENLIAGDFVKYLMSVVNEIPTSNTKREISDILSKIYNVKQEKENVIKKEEKPMQKELSNLEKYGENLNNIPYLKDPSIGRDDVIRKIERILLYPERDKSIIITGPAGTGKTAIVKGLAYRIQNGNVPDALKNLKIISIDAPSIVAGCKYVGMLEEKLKGILDDASYDSNTVIFIDEIHQAMGAGRSEGNKVTVSEILKPYLDYGKVRIIGATTDEEHTESIECNTAFKSRLKRLKIDEPNNDTIYEIVYDLINTYNKISYSKVMMSEDEINTIINFLIDATTSKNRTYNDKVNNPRLVLDIVKEAYAISALNNSTEVTVDDFIEALNDEERIYDSSKQRCIEMLKQNVNYRKEKAIILEFKQK